MKLRGSMGGISEFKTEPRSMLCGVLFLLTLVVWTTKKLNDGQVLMELKNRGFQDSLNHLHNWNKNDKTPCNWIGVHYSSNGNNTSNLVVTYLNLSSMNLTGTLSPSIDSLHNLVYLNLTYNGLTGDIPPEIGNCSKLEVMLLNNNQFGGSIPVEIRKLSYLRSLNICNNKFSGPLPEEIGDLYNLEELVAYTNNLTSPLPRL
ncbi:unnamed protein product [Thlaspi arvense]|uniref:non-specific serine/threonine protein kinase n=1 Tax=Thlaspi arvense TaxID=13288 RepID=A0AAU9RTK9_THLAR|nr:unnamed protein product [Thlaspi arvense]